MNNSTEFKKFVFDRLVSATNPRLRYATFAGGLILLNFGYSWFLNAICNIETLWLRYVFSVTLTYLSFFPIVYFWGLLLQRKAFRRAPESQFLTQAEREFSRVKKAERPEKVNSGLSGIGDIFNFAGGIDELGAVLIGISVVLFLLFGSLFLFAILTDFLYVAVAEMIFEILFAMIIIRQVNRMEENHWLTFGLRASLRTFLIVLTVAAVSGYTIQRIFPEAESVFTLRPR